MTDEKTIEEYQKEADEYLNGWKRAKADFVNYQKQAEKDRAEWAMFAGAAFLKAMLPVLDSLEMAVSQFTVHSSQFTGDHGHGIVKIRDQMVDALRNMGVEEIKSEGEPVNIEFHEVVATEPSGEHASGLITKEAQRGYTMHGKVLRVAKVIVAE
ncbi:MAG: nucleotide exchange factor GrpE [bacterium]|nr:nucleotide exchange factor GrpE [bacterium]